MQDVCCSFPRRWLFEEVMHIPLLITTKAALRPIPKRGNPQCTWILSKLLQWNCSDEAWRGDQSCYLTRHIWLKTQTTLTMTNYNAIWPIVLLTNIPQRNLPNDIQMGQIISSCTFLMMCMKRKFLTAKGFMCLYNPLARCGRRPTLGHGSRNSNRWMKEQRMWLFYIQ